MNSLAIMENVRRYRTIASLYRQTAAFRPVSSCSLLAQAGSGSIAPSPSWKPIMTLCCYAASGNPSTNSASYATN